MSEHAQAFLAYTALILVSVGLIAAGLYAIYGKPKSDRGKKTKRQVTSGFQLGFGFIAVFLLFVTLTAGIRVGIFGYEARFTSKPLAYLLAAFSLSLLFLTAQRWGKYLGGFVAYSIFRAFFAAITGHLNGRTYERSFALAYALVAFVTVAATLRFTSQYRLGVLEKTALVLWMLAFAIGINTEQYLLHAMAIGAAILVLAWASTAFAPRGRRKRLTT